MNESAMNEGYARTADESRRHIADGTHDRAAFRAALLAVRFSERDAWVDRVLGLDALPDDGPELPPGCVPYLPCAADALVEMVDRAEIGPSDVLVDIGSGVGRALAVVHLLSGAAAIGVEIQTHLVEAAQALAARVSPRISTLHGDAVELGGALATGTVYFLYCPFGGERLEAVLARLATIARTRPIRVCCVDLPLPECDWLTPEPAGSGTVVIHRSVGTVAAPPAV